MVGVTDTFVPTYQGLSALDLLPSMVRGQASAFPLNAAGRLPFYRARNAIYHLFRVLVRRHPRLTVLAPDYHSGNEILAMRAAGARIRYYPVGARMQADVETVRRLCDRHAPDLLYVIHYIGWPQPVSELAAMCETRGMFLVEDCALSLFTNVDGRPLGTFGNWSIFCLYKTLPLPNGALLIQNGPHLDALDAVRLRPAGPASVAGRTAELLVQRIRGRVNAVGAALQLAKHGVGRVVGALNVHRANVGDIGFNLDEADLAMSTVCAKLLDRFDVEDIRQRRIANYRLLDTQLDPGISRVFERLPDGVCPLFFPILVRDKHAAASALQRRGVDALEFWNDSVESGEEMSEHARFLRAHVLELPIHQDLTPRQIAYMAQQVSAVTSGGIE